MQLCAGLGRCSDVYVNPTPAEYGEAVLEFITRSGEEEVEMSVTVDCPVSEPDVTAYIVVDARVSDPASPRQSS